MSENLTIPFNYSPRQYQLPVLRAIDSGFRRLIMLWPRRAGKDKTAFNIMIKKAMERKGTYFYFFPTYSQGSKILWEGMDRSGFKLLDHIPLSIRKRTDNTKMLIELANGSIIQIIGTDNIDSIVGTNPIGCIFSEFPLQDPTAWGFIRPILAENGGWAIFDYTPRGKMNHGYDLWCIAQADSKNWFSEKLTADDIGIYTPEILEQERKEILQQYGDEALYWQEYFCSFEATVTGAYYSTQIKAAEEQKRIGRIPYDSTIPVQTWWDLGVGDATAIWFTQLVGPEIRIIDYYEATGEGLPYYIKYLKEKPYIYDSHYAPHDIAVREFSSGVSRIETAQKLGINFQTVEKLSVDDGIDAVRTLFSRCYFDEVATKQGLNCLGNYHKEYDDKRKEYKNTPYHDWSSHGADAFRTLAVGYGQFKSSQIVPRKKKQYTPMTQYGG